MGCGRSKPHKAAEATGGVGPREIEGEAEPADEARPRLLEALRSGGGFNVLTALRDAPVELRADRDFILKAVESNGPALKYAAEELRADRDFILKAVESNGPALEYAAEELRADRDVVLKAVETNGLALEHAAEELRADRDFILKAVQATRADWLLQFAAAELREDEALARRCKEAAGTGLVFTYYRSYDCFLGMRIRFPAACASVPGGGAYEMVIAQLWLAEYGSTAIVWFDQQLVFGHAADDGRWTHPSHDCGRDMVPVPPGQGREAKWSSTVDSRSQSLVPEVGKSYVCWCCRWLREVRRHHERGEVICCAVSNIYQEDWVRKYGAGSSELSDADAELHGLPRETFKNGKPPGWGEGQIRISDGSSFERRAPVHDRTKKPQGVGCRWERQALDNMEFPVYAFFTP